MISSNSNKVVTRVEGKTSTLGVMFDILEIE